MPSDEETRLRRALKDLAERLELVVYDLPASGAKSSLEAIARDARAALPPPPSPLQGP